jgi:hypothetical protein
MAALDRFAADVDVVTYEFENVPAETATFLSARKPVLPDPKVLATTQDRLIEKEFVQSLGIGTANFAAVDSAGHARIGIGEGRAPRRAEDAALRLRRQGPGDDPRRRRSRRCCSTIWAGRRRSWKPSCRSSARYPSSRHARAADRSKAST